MITKKVTRRILAFTLALTLMLALASTASATTVYWTSTDGTSNQATVKKVGDWYYVYQPITDATICRHEAGTASLVTWPTGYYASYKVSWPASAKLYQVYLNKALTGEGLSLTAQTTAPEDDFYVIKAEVPTGTYSYGTEIKAYDANWSVVLGSSQAPVNSVQEAYALAGTAASGTLRGAVSHKTANKLIPVED